MELESLGIRRLLGYGICVTRGAAAIMSLCFSVLLLTMCRNCITYLRETIVNNLVPFDSVVQFHKQVAVTALFAAAMHVLGYSVNVYSLSTQPREFLCLMHNFIYGYNCQFL